MPDYHHNLYEAAFADLPDAACIVVPVDASDAIPGDWDCFASNAAFCRLLDIDSIAGRSLRGWYPKQADRWASEFARVLTDRESITLTHIRSKQGQVLEIVLSPLIANGVQAVLVRIQDITRQRLAADQRRLADARYKLLFDAIDEGFCIIEVIFDEDGRPVDYRFMEANRALVGHTGFIDPVGKTVRELQPDIEDHWPAIYGRIAGSGTAERFESKSTAMDRWFDVFAFPIGEEAPYQVGVLFEDVGARKAMEFALRESESRLQSLIEASSDIIFRANPEGTVMQPLGGTALLGDFGSVSNWIDDFVPESDRASVRAAFADAIHGRAPMEIEHRIARADGTIGWLSSRAVPVVGEDGAIMEWFGMATDITQRHQFEQQLAHGAQMLRMASEIGKIGLWDWNVETGEITWSDEYYRMEGFKVGEVVPSYDVWVDRVHPDDRANSERRIAQAMKTGKEYLNENRVIHPNGEVRWLSAHGRFLYDDKGSPVRMLGAMIDTTERRSQEEWQKLLVAELQHRVRNLIGMVRSMARLSSASHRNVDDYVDHLIGRLQAMGRTQSTLTRSPGKSVDLDELVSEELLAHAASEDKYHIDGPDVALSPYAAEIITLAVHELATNSIKYGALGNTGYIRIIWRTSERDGKPWLMLRWQETAPVSKGRHTRKGFGRRLIEERVPYELQGEGCFKLHDTGVLAELNFPLTDAGSIFETRS